MAIDRIIDLPEDNSPSGGDYVPIDNSSPNQTRRTRVDDLLSSAGAGVFATAAQGALADSALQPADIGVDVQGYDADLAAIAGLVSAADKMPYATGAGTWALTDATSVGRSLLGSALVADVRNILDTAPYVATRTALKALDPTKDTTVTLTEGVPARNGRFGTFIWQAGDYSTQITADPNEGVYLKADSVASTSGAWVRRGWDELDPHWFGCAGDNSTDDASAFQAMVNFIAAVLPERKVIALGNAKYLANSQIMIPPACLQLVMYGNGPYASQIRSATVTAGQPFLVYAQGCHFEDFRLENDTFDVSAVARDGFLLTKSYGVTEAFAAAVVNTTTDEITVASNTAKWLTGFPVQMTTTGVLPTGISALTDYYVIRINATTIKLASSFSNAIAGTAIDITAAGSGTHTILSTPECDIDAEFHNVEISRFRYAVNLKGRGLRFENSLCSVSYHPIYLDYPSVGEYTPGPNVQEDLAGFRAVFITDNRFHSNTSAAVANIGTNAAKINGLLLANNLVDIGRPLFYGHLGIGGSVIIGNVINETPLEGLNLTGGFDYLVIGNTISGSEGIAGGERIPDNFVKMTGTHDNGIFRGNLFKRCKSHGFDIRTGTATRIIITGNTFLDPCQDIGSFCPVAFVGANHTGMVYHNQIDTANALTGVVRTNDATANVEVGHHDFLNTAIPLAIGTSQKYHATLAEKGTWTPALKFGGASTGLTVSDAQGAWTRQGTQVVVDFQMTLTAKGSSTGSASITGLSGLPIPSNAKGVGEVMVQNMTGLTSAIQSQMASSGQIDLYQTGATGRAALTDAGFTNTSIIRGSIAFTVT